MKPTVGRIVHFVQPWGAHSAAIIICVHPDDAVVDLVIFVSVDPLNPRGSGACANIESRAAVPQGAEDAVLTWHWPERE